MWDGMGWDPDYFCSNTDRRVCVHEHFEGGATCESALNCRSHEIVK